MPIDPYILLLLGTVGLAALLPARGTGADVASGASTAAMLGNSGGGFSADSLVKIVLQLLVPFLAGQFLRRWVGSFIVRHKKVLGYVDRGSILLVVYTAFSEGMVQGIWHQVSAIRLAGLLAVEAVLLAVMLALTWYGGKALRFDGEDRIAIQFAGSKKSLA